MMIPYILCALKPHNYQSQTLMIDYEIFNGGQYSKYIDV